MMKRHLISLTVENRHGALSRIANLFSGRGYNISSLNVAETDDPTISRMSIVVTGEDDILEQIVKHLNKLIDVIKVIDFSGDEAIEREMMLIRVDSTKSNRHELLEIANLFNAKVTSVTQNSVILEVLGNPRSIDDLISLVKPYGIREIVRSGTVAIANSKK
jgi:acetolactate synthase I/III small subunit